MQLAINALKRLPGLMILLVGMFIVAYALKINYRADHLLQIEVMIAGAAVVVFGIISVVNPAVGQSSAGSGNRVAGIIIFTGLALVLSYLRYRLECQEAVAQLGSKG